MAKTSSSLHLVLSEATTPEPTPPLEEKLITLLSFGNSVCDTAPTCIESLLDRLRNTHNSFTAFKCLITLHYIIKHGSYIHQHQLSVSYLSADDGDFLNLSSFLDYSNFEAWYLSFWANWYADILDLVLFATRNLGYERVVSSFSSKVLLGELDVLIKLVEELCKAPELVNVHANKLVNQVMLLLEEDKCYAEKEILRRVNELKGRISTSIELVCVLKRLESCNEKLSLLFSNKDGSIIGDKFLGLIEDLKEKIDEEKRYVCEGR